MEQTRQVMKATGRSESDFHISLETRRGLETAREIFVSNFILEL